MRKALLVLPLLLFLVASCLSEGTRDRLDAQRDLVRQLKADVITAEVEGSPNYDLLRQKFVEEQIRLQVIEEEATRERVGSGGQIAETVIETAKPFASALSFPPLMVALGILGSVATALKNKYAKEE